MIVSYMFVIVMLYLIACYISHCHGCCFGEVVPSWLCVFCLGECVIKKIKRRGGVF